jgi:hypothetical protein
MNAINDDHSIHFTVDEVTTMVLAAIGTESDYDDPSLPALTELATSLSSLAWWAAHPPGKPFWEDVLTDTKAFDAATVLAAAIGPRRDLIVQNPSYPGPGGEPDRIRALAALDGLAAALAAAMGHLKPLPPMGDAPKGWHGTASLIEHAFRIAMKSTNPDAVLGTPADGPVAKFVAAVATHFNGNAVSAAAAAKYLQRHPLPDCHK